MAKKIILVHGLGSSSKKTWGKFPELLESDPEIDYQVITHDYNSPAAWNPLKWLSSGASINNLADGLLTAVRQSCDLENDDIILAGHSMGGLVVKKMLLKLRDKGLDHNISKVCFFDVPHDGSGFANLASQIARRNRHLKALVRDGSELDDLHDQWNASGYNDILTIKSINAETPDYVSSFSSKSNFRNFEIDIIPGTNHSTVVKPENHNSHSYISFKRFVLLKNNLAAYKIATSRTLSEWMRIDPRDHSFPFVNDELRKEILESFKNALANQKCVVRITGASGLGKSRMILEALESSETVSDGSVMLFDANGYDKEIRAVVRRAVEKNIDAVFIIENCTVDLHNQLAAEMRDIDCSLSLVTVGYANEQVDDSEYINIPPLADKSISEILEPILVDMDSYEVERVAKFAQGYPLIAVLIAQQYQEYGHIAGSLERESVLKKLVDPTGELGEEDRRVLVACSIFDVFGTTGFKAEDEAKFIAEDLANSSIDVFDKVINHFLKRQIIHRIGRYARVIPKPLAISLASEWWGQAQEIRKRDLIRNIPDSLVESFCTQIAYLDHEPSVKEFSEHLFSGPNPFVNAEELLSERGSKFFRSFVEVNPSSTSPALYRVLSLLDHENLTQIHGETRRNLLRALEMLCFHREEFSEAAWCMLLLANAENESWSNNATGMFSQLFRVNLSGTAAEPQLRLKLLRKALEQNIESMDLIIIEALNNALSYGGGSRMIGAEYQGTKAPLKEWEPKKWHEIFEYWDESVSILLKMLNRGEAQKTKALYYLGGAIRDFASYRQFELIEKIITEGVRANGIYWPEALKSLQDILEYDIEKFEEDDRQKINALRSYLDPVNAPLQEKLKIIVVDPPWSLHKDENEEVIDTAQENAKQLGIELSHEVDSIIDNLDILLIGDQKQTSIFGYTLAKSIDEEAIFRLIDACLSRLACLNKPNTNLLLGICHALSETSPDRWEEVVSRVYLDPGLIQFYPLLIRTGCIEESHLQNLLESIETGVLNQDAADVLGYGRVTEHLSPSAMAKFTLNLSKLGQRAAWSALNVLFMYYFSNRESLATIKAEVKEILTTVDLGNKHKTFAKNVHHWKKLAEKLLEDFDEAFAKALVHQMLFVCSEDGFEHGDLWSEIKPFLLKIMPIYYQSVWPLISEAIVNADGIEKYWLQQLLDRETSHVHKMPSVLSAIPVSELIKWAEEYPETGPVFVARCINIFDQIDGEKSPSSHFIEWLKKYAGNQAVTSTLAANISERSWTGSLIPYLEEDKEAIRPLLSHEDINVVEWTKKFHEYIDREIEKERIRDEESELGLF